MLLNEELPFRYPLESWAGKVQGNVTLRLFVDVEGYAVPESTSVAESSGIAQLDEAALLGVAQLRFRPAFADDKPVAAFLLLPVLFRHPDAPPLPGDSVIGIITPPPPEK